MERKVQGIFFKELLMLVKERVGKEKSFAL